MLIVRKMSPRLVLRLFGRDRKGRGAKAAVRACEQRVQPRLLRDPLAVHFDDVADGEPEILSRRAADERELRFQRSLLLILVQPGRALHVHLVSDDRRQGLMVAAHVLTGAAQQNREIGFGSRGW